MIKLKKYLSVCFFFLNVKNSRFEIEGMYNLFFEQKEALWYVRFGDRKGKGWMGKERKSQGKWKLRWFFMKNKIGKTLGSIYKAIFFEVV